MEDYYEQLVWYYNVAYRNEYDINTPQHVGWYDKEHQTKRFKNLISIGVNDGHSILDYGSGTGDLLPFLSAEGLDVDYFGIDINDKYLDVAKERFPDVTFYLGDVVDINPQSRRVDWVIASGVFSVLVPEDWIFFRIGVCTKLVKKGIAFNLLKKSEDTTQLKEYNPEDIKIKLMKLYPEFNINIIDDYLEDDFTIHMVKRVYEF